MEAATCEREAVANSSRQQQTQVSDVASVAATSSTRTDAAHMQVRLVHPGPAANLHEARVSRIAAQHKHGGAWTH